jgi:hypothetical protein
LWNGGRVGKHQLVELREVVGDVPAVKLDDELVLHAHMSRLDEAREMVKRLRAVTSVVIPDASFLRNPEHRELFLSGLRLAAGET